MDITTIKLQKQTKLNLDKLRKGKESYDATLRRLLSQMQASSRERELVEAYKEQADEALTDWKHADAPW